MAAIGIFFMGGYTARYQEAANNKVYKLALFLLILTIPATAFSIFPTNSFSFLRQDYIKNFTLMVLIMCGIRSIKNLERLVLFQVLGGLIYCAWVNVHTRMVDGRLGSMPYYDANDLGLMIVATVPFCMHFLRKGVPTRLRLFSLISLGALMLGFVKSGSRGGFLGLLTVMVFFLLTFDSFTRKARILTLVVGFGGVTIVGGDAYWELMQTMLHPSQDYNWSGKSDAGRMEVWKRGMGYMIRRPLFGVGPNNFYVAEGTMSKLAKRQQFGRGLKWSAPHNSFVQAGAELGVPGLLAFIFMLYHAFRMCYRKQGDETDPAIANANAFGRTLAATVAGYVVTAFFLSQAYAAVLYTMLGIVLAFAASRPTHRTTVQAAGLPAVPRPLGRGGLFLRDLEQRTRATA